VALEKIKKEKVEVLPATVVKGHFVKTISAEDEEALRARTALTKNDGIGKQTFKYTLERALDFCDYVRAGNSIKDTCRLMGMPYKSYIVWCKRNPTTFVRMVEQAEAECKGKNIAIVQAAGERNWQASAWYLERKYADEFALQTRGAKEDKSGDKIAVQLVFKEGKSNTEKR